MQPVRVACLVASLGIAGLSCSRTPATHRSAPDAAPSSTMNTSSSTYHDVFGPTVAGRFYPGNPTRLRSSVASYLEEGAKQLRPFDDSRRLVAIIAPHAGYVFSGSIAGVAYAAAPKAKIKTVVVLAPSHHGRRPYACLLDADAYRTPLGEVGIAKDLVKKLDEAGGDLAELDEAIFQPEHAADVQVPFVQLAFPEARLVPVIVPSMPRPRLEALGKLLYEVVGSDPHTLVVASTDLSHFYGYAEAHAIDEAIVGELERKDLATVFAKHDTRRGPCGVAPIAVTLAYLAQFGEGGEVKRLQVLNSGDTQPDNRGRVVGYAAMAMTVPAR
jgi:MEMO1 family protein